MTPIEWFLTVAVVVLSLLLVLAPAWARVREAPTEYVPRDFGAAREDIAS